jgi:hypothetical protein
MSEHLTTIEIKIARTIDENGALGFQLTIPNTYSSVEVLGLLEAAKYAVYTDMRRNSE